MAENLAAIATDLIQELDRLTFGPPVAYVYNPLRYAWAGYAQYLGRYGAGPKDIILVGMNPGPWGMMQTGVPFGEIAMVRQWLGIAADVGRPEPMHPKRPVEGFSCRRSEVSGRRLWGWARDRYGTPAKFFSRFFVANYCPLGFLEESGRNRTPDKLPKDEGKGLFAACDRALYRTVLLLRPRYVVGIGRFAAARAEASLRDLDITIGSVTHPSPANPRANRGWAAAAERELTELGIEL